MVGVSQALVVDFLFGTIWNWRYPFSTFDHILINSYPPSAAYIMYMRQWTGSALVQVMTCRLFGDKPSPAPMLDYYQLDRYEQTSVKFESKYKTFH